MMDTTSTLLHIIYLEEAIVLSKKAYSSWREIQDEYPTYITSLGPWPVDDVIGFFSDDYGPHDQRWPFSRQQIAAFLPSNQLVLTP